VADVDLSSLAQRLDRIEQTLSRLSGLGDLLNAVDPPPDDLTRVRPLLAQLLQLIRRPPHGDPAVLDLVRRRPPVADPAVTDLARSQAGSVADRLAEILQRNPGWFADPPPEDYLNVRLLDLVRRWRGGFTDPAPDDLAHVRLRDLLQRIPGGGFTDPAPSDLARLTTAEVETQLHKVNTEMVRLKSLERLLNDHLSQAKKTAAPSPSDRPGAPGR
jgi:hypothetical protein